MTLLFCNIGWMDHYQGLGAGDIIRGGGAYVKEKGRGDEMCNFTVVGGVVHGYVQPPGQEIDIDRIGANPSDDSISGITVVWTATRPTGGTAVIGWYKNATIFRRYQKIGAGHKTHTRNGISGFWVRARSKDAKLLTVDERTCEIPRQVKGGMGQSNIWYADAPESISVVRRVTRLVNGKRPSKPIRTSRPKTQDQERKVQIEKAAIRACCDHFERLGYLVRSVEKDNVGWDLVARSGKTILQIEVKGLSGPTFAVELTPNEFKAFSKHSDAYRLAVVVSALTRPKLLICRYSSEQQAWVVDGNAGKRLNIQTRESASIRCS